MGIVRWEEIGDVLRDFKCYKYVVIIANIIQEMKYNLGL